MSLSYLVSAALIRSDLILLGRDSLGWDRVRRRDCFNLRERNPWRGGGGWGGGGQGDWQIHLILIFTFFFSLHDVCWVNKSFCYCVKVENVENGSAGLMMDFKASTDDDCWLLMTHGGWKTPNIIIRRHLKWAERFSALFHCILSRSRHILLEIKMSLNYLRIMWSIVSESPLQVCLVQQSHFNGGVIMAATIITHNPSPRLTLALSTGNIQHFLKGKLWAWQCVKV